METTKPWAIPLLPLRSVNFVIASRVLQRFSAKTTFIRVSLYIRDDNGSLLQLAEVVAGPDLYEKEIEELVWNNLELFGQDTLFPLRRQVVLPSGGQPDILALDKQGKVVVIEVKRDIDRKQLAQALEYAGWARSNNLDELAKIYFQGEDAFFTDWQEFTESVTPVTINHSPRLVLIARLIHDRTNDALKFLRDNGLPVSVVPVSIYEDDQRRWLVEIEHDSSGVMGSITPSSDDASKVKGNGQKTYMVNGHMVQLHDLIVFGVLAPDTVIEFTRKGTTTKGTVTSEGNIAVGDQLFSTPSAAGVAAVGHAVDGWVKWRVPAQGGVTLADLRQLLLEKVAGASDHPGSE